MSGVSSTFSLATPSSIQHIRSYSTGTVTTSVWNMNFLTDLQAGDFILVSIGAGNTSAPSINSSGYTSLGLSSLNVSGTDIAARYYYKISDGTETSVAINASTSNGSIGSYSIFRGVDNTNPLDVAQIINTDSTYRYFSYQPVPDIAPITDGALIIKGTFASFGGTATSYIPVLTDSPFAESLVSRSYPSGTVNLSYINASTTVNSAIKSFSGAPNAFDDLGNYYHGYSQLVLALRPAYS